MTLRAFCNRCDELGEITSRSFASGINVIAVQREQSPTHLCEGCLAEVMLEAVVSLSDTPTARDYAETKQKAADCGKAYAMVERVSAERDELKDKLAEARSQTTVASRYDAWTKERSELLEQVEALKKDRDVATVKAAQAEKNAAEVVKRAQAAQVQSKIDGQDEAYVASVAAREAKRQSGR